VTGKAGYNAAGLRWVPGPCRRIRRSEHRQIAGLAPVDRETLLQTTNKATDHRHTDGAHHRHEQSGSWSASKTNRLAMVVIWSDAQHSIAVTRRPPLHWRKTFTNNTFEAWRIIRSTDPTLHIRSPGTARPVRPPRQPEQAVAGHVRLAQLPTGRWGSVPLGSLLFEGGTTLSWSPLTTGVGASMPPRMGMSDQVEIAMSCRSNPKKSGSGHRVFGAVHAISGLPLDGGRGRPRHHMTSTAGRVGSPG
jgi:hypothetical protein